MIKLITFLPFLFPTLVFTQSFPVDQIQKTMDRAIDNKQIFGAVVSIGKEDSTYHFASGNIEIEDSYFIASVSKLYTSAVLFKLIDQGKLNLEDSIKNYLTDRTMNGLHIYKDNEYSNSITIRHLVSNTSGLSDYFMQENNQKQSLYDHLISVGDTSLAFDQMIMMTKQLPSKFPPGTQGKAHYSDGNFQLLGKIIQNVTGKTMEEAYEEYIFHPLGLEKTYLYNDPSDTIPTNFYYKKDVLMIPNMMASFQSDGGIVSTSEEGLHFLKAHFNEKLHSKRFSDMNTEWNKIYSPFQYGYGLMKFRFVGIPEMIGHAGANGSFAYYIPSKKIYITGTINQINKPQLVYKLIAKILATIKK